MKYTLTCSCGVEWVEELNKENATYEDFTCPNCGKYENIFIEYNNQTLPLEARARSHK